MLKSQSILNSEGFNSIESLTNDLREGLITTSDFKIIRHLKERSFYSENKELNLQKGVIVDVETTGLNSDTDRIIEIGIITFEFEPQSGKIIRIIEKYNSLNDPGFPISIESTQIHHITNEMVLGKKIDILKINQLVSQSSLVISHNAKFDRAFLEKEFPIFTELEWACSFSQIDWRNEGIGSSALEFIAYKYGFFYEGHRAEIDCLAVLEILAQPTPKSNTPGLKFLNEKKTSKEWTVFALKSKFETKDLLKARKYQWDPKQNVWFTTVNNSDSMKIELEWLKKEIYNGKSVELGFEERDSYSKFSKRNGHRYTKVI